MNDSRLPIVRAGFANILFFIGPICLVILNQALIDAGVQYYLKMIALAFVLLIFVKYYINSASKISFIDGFVLIELPLYQKKIKLHDIKNVKITTINSSKYISVKITYKNKVWARKYSFVAPVTRYGDFESSVIMLRNLFECNVTDVSK